MCPETNIGEFIKQLREKRGFTQRQLAYRSGVSNTEINRIESGERKNPSPDALKKLAGPLGAALAELYSNAGYLNEERGDYETKVKKVDLADTNFKFYWKGRPLTDDEIEGIRIGQEARELWKKKQKEKKDKK